MKECKNGEGILFSFSVIIVSLLIIITNVLQSNREMGVVMNGRFLSSTTEEQKYNTPGEGIGIAQEWVVVMFVTYILPPISVTPLLLLLKTEWEIKYKHYTKSIIMRYILIPRHFPIAYYDLLILHLHNDKLQVLVSWKMETLATILLFFIRNVRICPLFRIDCQFKNNNETQLEQFRM